ncbi:uncharacterized protein F54H12.2 [Trichonephila clavipes]|nr:uncharacterized protein F54H12.2 [Trichonephila clavipes]
MAFLLKDSPECAKSELNLFALPPTQTVIERGQWVQFHPIANVSDGGPIEFVISGSGEEYLDLLSNSTLYGQPMPHQPLELDFEKDNYIRVPESILTV